MIRGNKNIDNLFKETLQGFKEKPPVNAWDRLDRDLSVAKSNKSKIYFRWIAASLLLFIAFGAGYFYANYESKNQILTENENGVRSSSTESQEVYKPAYTEISTTNIESQNTPIFNETLETQIPIDEKAPIISNSDQPKEKAQTNNPILFAENTLKVQTEKENEKVNSSDNKKLIHASKTEEFELEEISQPEEISYSLNDNVSKLESISLNPQFTEENFILPKDNKDYLKWSIGAQVAPVVSYREISTSYSSSLNTSSDIENDLNNIENRLIAYGGGVNVNYNLSNKWSINSGVYISRIGQVNNDALTYEQDKDQYVLTSITTSTGEISIITSEIPNDIKQIDSSKDTISLPTINDVKVIQNFDLFEVPLIIKYKFLNKKFGMNVSGGLSPAYIIDNSTQLKYDENTYDIGSSSNLNSMIFNTSFSLGFEFAISKKFIVNMEPTFKYSLNPINKNNQFNYHPYSFSWFTGFRYSF